MFFLLISLYPNQLPYHPSFSYPKSHFSNTYTQTQKSENTTQEQILGWIFSSSFFSKSSILLLKSNSENSQCLLLSPASSSSFSPKQRSIVFLLQNRGSVLLSWFCFMELESKTRVLPLNSSL